MNARKFYSNDEKQILINKFIASGKSKNSWCKENNISLTTFHKWLKKINIPNVEEAKMKFIQIKPSKVEDLDLNQKCEDVFNSSLVLEIGKCKLSIPQNINISHLDSVLKVVIKLDL